MAKAQLKYQPSQTTYVIIINHFRYLGDLQISFIKHLQFVQFATTNNLKTFQQIRNNSTQPLSQTSVNNLEDALKLFPPFNFRRRSLIKNEQNKSISFFLLPQTDVKSKNPISNYNLEDATTDGRLANVSNRPTIKT